MALTTFGPDRSTQARSTFRDLPSPRGVSRASGVRGNGRQSQIRLTRRGRVVVVLGVLGILLVGGFTLGRVSASSAAGTPQSVVVQPGDTMWSLAVHAAPHRDPRAVIANIERLNAMSTDQVVPGQILVLPS